MINFDVNKLLNLLENTDTGFYILSETGAILHCNQKFLDYIGESNTASVIGKDIFTFIDPENKEEFQRFINKCLTVGSYNDFETVLSPKDNVFTYILQSGILEEVKGNVHISVLCRNITRRKIIEENLRSAKEKIEESDKLKTAFLSNLSHEVRTPMNAIIGFSELLMNSNISAEQKEKYLIHITNSGNVLLNLIDDIIDVAKIQSGQLSIKKTRMDINHLLFEIFSSYVQLCKSKKGDDVELILNQTDKASTLKIYTDPLRLRQIFTNLLSNALKFTDKGYIEFGYIYDESSDVKPITFYVKDTGIGLSSKHKDLIFDRFFKIEDDNLRLYRGAGLGLSIAKSLVNLLGGEIWVESEQGQGSVFYFTIPNTDCQKSTSNESVVNEIIDFENWKSKHILIAEDEDINFIFIEELLNKYNLNIIRAKNGLEAVEYVQSNKEVDLILMDIKMPMMDGYKATELIKGISNKIPIVAQTAYALAGEKEKILDAGCDDYIAKPIKQSNLVKILAKYLQ